MITNPYAIRVLVLVISLIRFTEESHTHPEVSNSLCLKPGRRSPCDSDPYDAGPI